MVGCRKENTLDQVLLSEEEISGIKSKIMEKVKEHKLRWNISAAQWNFEISAGCYGVFGKVDYGNEKSFALPEYMKFEMTAYYKKLEGKEVIYNISMPKDLGDGFIEYVQYGINYNQLGDLESISYNGHALCYLPDKLQN